MTYTEARQIETRIMDRITTIAGVTYAQAEILDTDGECRTIWGVSLWATPLGARVALVGTVAEYTAFASR